MRAEVKAEVREAVVKSKAAIMRERTRARFTRKFTDQQIKQVVQAIQDGWSYKKAGDLVGMNSSSVRYWFARSGGK